jgi:methionine synthase II (cobalamin-independent)
MNKTGAAMAVEISRETIIEDLVEAYPDAVTFLMEKGIRCLRCGEPIWGSLASAMDEKDFPIGRQMEIVTELRGFLGSH